MLDVLETQELLVPNEDLGITKEIAQENVSFERMFFMLLIFIKERGHAAVPATSPDYKELSEWVANVRNWRITDDTRLTKSRLSCLERCGFVWDANEVVNAPKVAQAGDTYELQVLNRLVPKEEEPELEKQVKEEFADLLKCDEPVVYDKNSGIGLRTIEANQTFERRFLDFLVFYKAHGHGTCSKRINVESE